MLGEIITESSGKMTGVRILSAEGSVPELEVSLQGSGTLLGQEMTEFITYVQTIRPGGELYGEGQAVGMTRDGDMAVWTGIGVGRLTGKGHAASYRAAGTFQTTAEKLMRLNGVATVLEYEVDENGNYSYQEWEWK